MQDSTPRLQMPQELKNHNGETRHIGVELEMSGLSIDQLSTYVADFFNLSVEKTSRYQYTLQGDPEGEWVTELDFRLLKKMGEQEHQGKHLADIESLLELISHPLVPHEIISPPLSMYRLPEVQDLVVVLRQAGAEGTSESVLNAFSMQLNPEVPSLDVKVLTAYLKAFLCLYEWLFEKSSINMARRITTYVDPFPKKYTQKVLAADYWPETQTELIRDYLQDNPTRNRALDMLPLFSHLDAALVEEYTNDPLIKARPAFHYRLPNCEIHMPDWNIHLAWHGWMQVEALAHDNIRLQNCARAYLRTLNQPWWKRLLSVGKANWPAQVNQQWLVHFEQQ